MPYHAGDGHIARHVRELDVHKLGYIQRAVIVPTRGDGRGDHDACGVNGLENAPEMALPSNLFDEYRCKALGA